MIAPLRKDRNATAHGGCNLQWCLTTETTDTERGLKLIQRLEEKARRIIAVPNHEK